MVGQLEIQRWTRGEIHNLFRVGKSGNKFIPERDEKELHPSG